jgi:hypothetical protein
MKTATSARKAGLTSTQKGAIGESIVSTGLMLASKGQLSPYRPVADDDGIDLLLVDKLSRDIVQLQVKARTGVDNAMAGTVQFDVRLNTFAEGARGYFLGVLLEGAALDKAWLIPLAGLRDAARTATGKLVVVASAKGASNDRFRKFRHDDFGSLSRAILGGNAR